VADVQLRSNEARFELTARLDPPPCSSSAGSAGGGPSIAHLRLSYFDRMNDSILLSMSACVGRQSTAETD
jgi:hypothetical protein